MQLSKEIVLQRLEIKDLSRLVRLLTLDFLMGPAQAENPREEDGGERAETAENSEEHVTAGGDKDHWKARLQDLEIDEQQPFGWSGILLYGKEKFIVDSDLLAPRFKDEPPEAKQFPILSKGSIGTFTQTMLRKTLHSMCWTNAIR